MESVHQEAFEIVEFDTHDGFNISASLGIPTKSTGAAVVFIHEGGSDRSEWGRMPARCLSQGWVTLAYDIRGHGGSSGEWDDAWYTRPRFVTEDLLGAITFLETLSQLGIRRIALVGSSIGGNIACAMGSHHASIVATVSLSAKTIAVRSLGDSSDLALETIYHIASQGDENGDRAAWAYELFQSTSTARKLEITEGAAHGVGCFEEDPMLQDRIIDWLIRKT